nr:carboxypeptidase-like regulatory domain-containing protein [uncultured Flavobacterium sp.]
MKNKITGIVLFLFVSQISFGQAVSIKEIQGQIFEQPTSVDGVNIINNNTQVTTVSDVNGMFSIVVREGDVLVFSSVNLETLKHRITVEDLASNSLLIKMRTKEIELKEVIVNENAHITAENLGIIPKGQKKYTPAERRLASGSSFLSAINGNKKRLKKNVEVEKKESYIEKIGYMYEDAYFVDYLKIPLEHVRGFKFYMVEDAYVKVLLEKKDKSKLTSFMSELALKYNEIILSENK